MAVLDWRRRVAQLYAQVREEPDPRAAHQTWVRGRDALLREHEQSPLPQECRALPGAVRHAAYDPAWRFAVDVLPAEALTIEAPTGTDGVVRFERIGRLRLPAVGELDVWWLLGYGGGVFVPFADAGEDTYPGGRYVIDTVKGADLGGTYDAARGLGSLVVDLNFAYNPSCAYDPAWACPLAPPGNRLGVTVPVGELTPRLGRTQPA